MAEMYVDLTQNPLSPYYLHPREDPGVVLVSAPMNGTNYHSWSRAMKRVLLSKNKFKFVTGEIKISSSNDPLYSAWERCNMIVVSWMTRTLASEIAQCTIYIENATDLWNDLKDCFYKGNHFRMSDLLQDIHSAKQGDRTVSVFFMDLKIMWEELESL